MVAGLMVILSFHHKKIIIIIHTDITKIYQIIPLQDIRKDSISEKLLLPEATGMLYY